MQLTLEVINLTQIDQIRINMINVLNLILLNSKIVIKKNKNNINQIHH